ncbi:MAG TPA: Ig-like domain-containing protein, partial [Mycobacteriales bacterium]|nr:Ig-like domain-containing protein [Mycobacteriales bacterium]
MLAVSSTNPVDAATGVARNASISVTFNKPAQPLTTNTADGACSGSLQVSRAADNFATCVQMSAAPSPSGATSPTFIVTPVAPLVGSNKYFIRVTTSAVDAAGVAMANTYTSASGFTTSLALVVQSYSPSGPNVPRNSAVAVSFNRPADPTSLTAITSGTACGASTLQLSNDGFVTCVPMTIAVPVASNGNAIFTLQPASPLTGTYSFRVKAMARDSDGVPLGTDATGAPFTTKTPLQVTGWTPADGTTSVALNTPVTVTFNRAPLASSITTNTADTICSGSIQLSRTSDNFNSCVRMATVPSSGDSVTWTVAPLSSLDPTTTYLIRVTRAALDSDGVPAAPFTSGGFTTNQAIVVTGVTPAPATTGVPLNTQISVTFNRAPASITAARADCSGAVALSFDSTFRSGNCVPLAAPLVSGNTATLSLNATQLLGQTNYFVRVGPPTQ